MKRSLVLLAILLSGPSAFAAGSDGHPSCHGLNSFAAASIGEIDARCVDPQPDVISLACIPDASSQTLVSSLVATKITNQAGESSVVVSIDLKSENGNVPEDLAHTERAAVGQMAFDHVSLNFKDGTLRSTFVDVSGIHSHLELLGHSSVEMTCLVNVLPGHLGGVSN